MSARAALAAVAAAVVASALVPWGESPPRRLAGGDGDASTPRFDVNVDAASVPSFEDRTAGSTYYVEASRERPLVQGNLKAIGQLYLSRAFPVQVDARAEYELVLNGRDALVRKR